MINDPTLSLQSARLAVPLDALDGVVIASAERGISHLTGRLQEVHRGEHRGGDHPCPADPVAEKCPIRPLPPEPW
ncbi:MAG: hypothetical protein ACRDRS_11410 [Pseudonocardiaceae bacterium]